MGILRRRHGDDTPGGRRFQMSEKLASIGDDSWIEDGSGNRVYRVNGKALRVRSTFVLEDRSDHEVAKIQERSSPSATRSQSSATGTRSPPSTRRSSASATAS